MKNRKLLEKAGPVGHLVQPIYNKLKKRVKRSKTDVAKKWNRGVKKVID